ncbi:MAG: hypothetical protein ACYC35_15855 [Pirellulales bacterium]
MSENHLTPAPPAPRLGIAHLLLWVLGTCLVLSATNVIQQQGQFPGNHSGILLELAAGLAYGAAMAGLFIGVRRWWRHGLAVAHPGHMLLYLAAIAMILDLGLSLSLSALAARDDPRWAYRYLEYRQTIGHGAGAIILMAVIAFNRHGALWRIPLAVLLLLALSESLWNLLALTGDTASAVSFLNQIGPFWWRLFDGRFVYVTAAGALALGATAAVDPWISGKRRDWMHWTGVGVWLAMATPPLAIAILKWARG